MVASRVLLTIATLGLALRVEAAPAPIVFDFKDGLQGWELGGSAQRVQTQILGGEWAILGDGLLDGSASIGMQTDSATVFAVTMDVFFVEGDVFPLAVAIAPRAEFTSRLRFFSGTPLDLGANPGTWRFVFTLTGLHAPIGFGFNWGLGLGICRE